METRGSEHGAFSYKNGSAGQGFLSFQARLRSVCREMNVGIGKVKFEGNGSFFEKKQTFLIQEMNFGLGKLNGLANQNGQCAQPKNERETCFFHFKKRVPTI